MIKQPLVSIIIPMYNAEKYIEETIKSVMVQTYQNWEIIVVSNASTDKSVELIALLHDARIQVVELDINSGGPAKPRNIGLQHAQGEYIAFLDADDLWTKDKLEIQLSHMLENNINFSSTGKTNIDESSNEINFKAGVLAKINARNSKKNMCDLIKYRFVFTSSVMVSSQLKVHFNEEKNYIAVEDLCAWLNVFKNPETKYTYIEKNLLKYRIVEQSISSRGMEYKHVTKAYICILNFILKNELYDNMKCFYKACARDYSLNFLQKILGKTK